MPAAIITIAHVIGAGIAPWDVNKFKATFGLSVEVTVFNLRTARAAGLTPEVFFAAIASPYAMKALSVRKQEIWAQLSLQEKNERSEHEAKLRSIRQQSEEDLEVAFAQSLANAVLCIEPEGAEVSAALLAALRLLVSDVAGYEAWQRPCHALDVALAAIAKAEAEVGEPAISVRRKAIGI